MRQSVINKINVMKISQLAALVILSAAMMISGCTREEEPDHFRYTVNDYPLYQGFIHNYGMPEGASGYNFDVTIHSAGVSYNRDRHEFQGTGHLVFFQMFSSSATELAAGLYQFSADDTPGDPSTFNVANFGMDINFSEDTGTLVSAVSGVVKVSGTGDYRTFDFDCLTGTGEKITGHYYGFVPAYDMRDARK
jgi:hypothetical protein